MVDRVKFNVGLRKLALGSGASLRENTACVDIRVTPSHVELKTSSNGDCLRAGAAVLACGHGPGMTRKLGLGGIVTPTKVRRPKSHG